MPARHKALVLDANILIRAVLGNRVRNLILQHAGNIHFLVPQVCLEDARKYLPDLLEARGIDPMPAMELLEELAMHTQSLEAEWLEDYEQSAKERMRCRNLADWPVLAAALALDCPIWTQDSDFFGVGVVTWSTEHIDMFFRQ